MEKVVADLVRVVTAPVGRSRDGDGGRRAAVLGRDGDVGWRAPDTMDNAVVTRRSAIAALRWRAL